MTHPRSFLKLIIAFCAVTVVAVYPETGRTELSDRELEISIRERKRDFERFVIQRKAAAEKEARSAVNLSSERRANEARLLEIESNYRKTMKRYSMEEVEARDRADEARIVKELAASEVGRGRFVANRDRRRALERSIAPVDPYEEFEIDMKVEPEAKVSHPGAMEANP